MMTPKLNILETRENLIHTVDASRAETIAIRLNTMEQHYEKVAMVYAKMEAEKKQTAKELQEAEENMQIDEEADNEELKLREKIAHHLNKARFEVDSQVMLVDLMQGSKAAGFQKQLVPKLVKQTRKERVEANHVEVLKKIKTESLLREAEKLKAGRNRLEERYERGKRTSSELFEFSQRWRLRLPEGPRVDDLVQADYQFLTEGRPGKANLKITENGILTMTLKEKQCLESSRDDGSRTVEGWSECSMEVEKAQHRLMYLELFLSLRSGVELCGYEVDIEWGRLKVRGNDLDEIEFKFKGSDANGWDEMSIVSSNLPSLWVPSIERLALQALLNLPDKRDLLGILIEQVRDIKLFVKVDLRIKQKLKGKRGFKIERKLTKQEKRILIFKNKDKLPVMEVSFSDLNIIILQRGLSRKASGRKKKTKSQSKTRTKAIETTSIAQLDAAFDRLFLK